MHKKVLICLYGNDVAPRFDLTTEVFIASIGPDNRIEDEKSVVLPRASAEELCHMILTADIQTVICGGIEEEYYQYLTWKRITCIRLRLSGPAIGCSKRSQRARFGLAPFCMFRYVNGETK